MTEDYAIKQGPSATPYLVGGGLAGGATGAALGAWKPGWAKEGAKYASFEDLVKEKEDSFKSSMEGVDEDLKTKAEKAWKAGQDAGADYDKKLAEYQEANKAGAVVPDENYRNLETALNEKKNAVETKRQELIKAEVEKLKAANVGGTTAESTANQAIDRKAKQLFNATDKVERLINEKASAEEIKAARERVAVIEKELETLSNDIAEKIKYTGTEEQIKAAKEANAKEIREFVHRQVDAKTYERATVGQPKLVKDLIAQDAIITDAKAKTETSFDKLAELTGKSKEDIKSLNQIDLARTVKRNADIEKKNLQVLQDTLANYKKLAAKGKATELGLKDILGLFIGKKITINPGETEAEVIQKVINGLDEKQQKRLSRLIEGGVNEQTLTDSIKATEARINGLKEGLDGVVDSAEAIRKAKAQKQVLNNNIKAKYGADARVKDGVLYKGGKPYKAKGTAPALPKLGIDPKEIKDIKLQYTTGGTALTEEQIAQKAKEAVTDEMLKAEIEAQKVAQTAFDEAAAKLPKAEGKTAEALAKEFIEKNGSKEEAVKKATEGFKDDVAKLFEGKLKNGKLAAIIGGGVAAGMLLGMVFKPSNKE